PTESLACSLHDALPICGEPVGEPREAAERTLEVFPHLGVQPELPGGVVGTRGGEPGVPAADGEHGDDESHRASQPARKRRGVIRSEEHTSELSHVAISY